MPLYKTIAVNPSTEIKIWKITESYNELMTALTLKPSSLERVMGMKSEWHQRGYLSIRHLLGAFGYSDLDLYYDEKGKPFLNDGKAISITHTFSFSAVIISNHPIGIDIEKQRPKITRIATKFLNYELDYLLPKAYNYVNKLTIIWCIKESLYKLFDTKGLQFTTHFLVIPFEIEDGTTVAWIDYEEKKHRYNATFFEFEGFTCAYVLES